MNGFEWSNARDVAQASEASSTLVADAMASQSGRPANDAVVFKAGGIDIIDLMKEGLLMPRRVVNLRNIAGLNRISPQPDGSLRIGANVTLAQVAADALITNAYRALADAAGSSASPQIRNVATIGGNLLQRPRCWYFRSRAHHCIRKGGDSCFAFGGENQYHAIFNHNGCAIVHPSTTATALVALRAKVELSGAGGANRVVSLEDFFLLPEVDLQRENYLKPGEVLTAVVLPALSPSARSVHLKQGELDSFDWPIADVAVVLDRDGSGICRSVSIVLGAASPIPHRARAAEAALLGKPATEELARAVGHAALQGAAPLSKNGYKLPIFETLVCRGVLAAASP